MIVEGYSMDFYCDCAECGSRFLGLQTAGFDRSDATDQARKLGWRISRDRMFCYAPGHRVTPVAERSEEPADES